MNNIKYIIIPYIALGFVLSLAVGITYICDGYQTYYASPFVFQSESLASSLTYYFGVYGLLMNVLIWCIPIIIARVLILRLIKRKNSQVLARVYRSVVIVLLVFTTLVVAGNYLMMGNGFEPHFNYWYIDMDNDPDTEGTKCEGELVIFGG